MGDISLSGQSFELRGHDCPLGNYPSVAVPVGTLGGELVAVYAREGEPQFHSVGPDAKYNRHSRITTSTLRGFDPLTHGLFAFNETEVVIYDLGKEKAFYSRLLRYSPAFYIEPFYRLSLAIETDEMSLIRPVYFSCAKHMARDAPEFTEVWMKAIELVSSTVVALRGEWLRRLEEPTRERPIAVGPGTSALAERATDERQRLGPAIGWEMNSVTINRALSSVALEGLDARVFSGGVYATAILASLGFTDSARSASRCAKIDSRIATSQS
jgi:hypothetical protein